MENKDLKEAGLKVTSPRVWILRLLELSKERHLSAEEIYKALINARQEIGLATVYRVLSQFESAGLVTRHHFEEGYSVFERNRGHHHAHMVCIETGEVVEFINEDIEKLQRETAEAHGYDIVDHDLVLFVRPKNKPQKSG